MNLAKSTDEAVGAHRWCALLVWGTPPASPYGLGLPPAYGHTVGVPFGLGHATGEPLRVGIASGLWARQRRAPTGWTDVRGRYATLSDLS
jgi:hypothetical protein